MGRTIGIDLGTTRCCVAVLQGKTATRIDNGDGEPHTASVVAFLDDDDSCLSGQPAKLRAITNAAQTLVASKRLLGRRFDDDEVHQDAAQFCYPVITSPRGDAWVHVQGRSLSVEEVLGLLVTKLKQAAEAHLKEPVTQTVMTVPASFNDAERRATCVAARLAGLTVVRLLNEPTAAALAYSWGKSDPVARKIAVYDLGGGSFDISIVHLTDRVIRVLATAGARRLGGEDFDHVIMQHLCAQFASLHAIDLRQDKMALQRIREAAQKTKHELSSVTQTEVHLPFIATDAHGPKHLQSSITRDQFESLCAALIERTLAACQQALHDAKLQADDIDALLLLGGMSQMPQIRQRVGALFGRAASGDIDVDASVAVGAAVQAARCDGEIDDVQVLDITPASLGVARTATTGLTDEEITELLAAAAEKSRQDAMRQQLGGVP